LVDSIECVKMHGPTNPKCITDVCDLINGSQMRCLRCWLERTRHWIRAGWLQQI